ncbi:pentapeptide repeat-containing protein [Candidatus Protochlamydia sp. R18]|uniref:pentapeptide repeat-containing protein n=1 Tax=Candidatus Protochlamydia sp. R18 TaxID=1353977 RepID=UPI0005A6512B|nr:pentapeptide repeat-containing protein [Candidatus Protochlamydia sp. R18]
MVVSSDQTFGVESFIFPCIKDIEQSHKEKNPDCSYRGMENIAEMIFKKLEAQDLYRANLVCRQWKQIIEQNNLFESFRVDFRADSSSSNSSPFRDNSRGEKLKNPAKAFNQVNSSFDLHKTHSGYFYLDNDSIKYGNKIKKNFSPEDNEYIWKINDKLLSPHFIKLYAGSYAQMKSPEQLKTQTLLLKIVKLSRYCQNVKIAAANAMMILKRIGFSFVNQKLRGIRIPKSNIPRIILDYADLSKADLRGADLTDCSLAGTILDGAKLKGAKFGHLPYLLHQHRVLAAALSPNKKYLVSNDEENLYVWNLKTFQMKKQPIGKPSVYWEGSQFKFSYYPHIFLLFSPDGNFFLRAYSQGEIEIRKTESLELVNYFRLENIYSCSLLALTKDGTHLVCAANIAKKSKWISPSGPFEQEITLWRISKDFHHLECINKTKTGNLVVAISFSPEKAIIGTVEYNHFSSSFLEMESFSINIYSLFLNLSRINGWLIPWQGSYEMSNTGETRRLITKGKEVYIWDEDAGRFVSKDNKKIPFTVEEGQGRDEMLKMDILFNPEGTHLLITKGKEVSV